SARADEPVDLKELIESVETQRKSESKITLALKGTVLSHGPFRQISRVVQHGSGSAVNRETQVFNREQRATRLTDIQDDGEALSSQYACFRNAAGLVLC